MVIWEENKDYSSVIGSSAAPYINSLAADCGLATNYRAATHPSLPNYLTPTSGLSYAKYPFNTDCSPGGSCLATGPSIFSQETGSGHQWRSYEEAMPANCYKTTTDIYAARHNPAVYYPSVAADCARWDEPLGSPTSGPLARDVAAGALPSYSVVTPDVEDDMHNGTVAQGDQWLARWLPVITSGSDYRDGRLAIVIVWDEGFGSGNYTSHVPLLVVSASTRPGTRVSLPLTEASVLRSAEDLTGVGAHLGAAATATPLAPAFGLGP